MLNGNIIVFDIETVLTLFWNLTLCGQKLYLHYTELFELELFD